MKQIVHQRPACNEGIPGERLIIGTDNTMARQYSMSYSANGLLRHMTLSTIVTCIAMTALDRSKPATYLGMAAETLTPVVFRRLCGWLQVRVMARETTEPAFCLRVTFARRHQRVVLEKGRDRFCRSIRSRWSGKQSYGIVEWRAWAEIAVVTAGLKYPEGLTLVATHTDVVCEPCRESDWVND
jgi:hypothetical protein